MARAGEVAIHVKVDRDPMRARTRIENVDGEPRIVVDMPDHLRRIGKAFREAIAPVIDAMHRACIEAGVAARKLEEARRVYAERIAAERRRQRWIDQQVYHRVRHRNAAMVAASHDTDGPPYPWETPQAEDEVAWWRIHAGIEYDAMQVGQRIATAYTEAMERLLAIEAAHHDRCRELDALWS